MPLIQRMKRIRDLDVADRATVIDQAARVTRFPFPSAPEARLDGGRAAGGDVVDATGKLRDLARRLTAHQRECNSGLGIRRWTSTPSRRSN